MSGDTRNPAFHGYALYHLFKGFAALHRIRRLEQPAYSSVPVLP